MTHTEESLMALADRLAVLAQFASDHLDERNALRLAIREVLKKNQELALNSLSAYSQAEENLERAERAEQENLQRGNVIGRITAHLLGNKNNVTDEDVVIAAAEVGRELQGARERIERLQALVAPHEPVAWVGETPNQRRLMFIEPTLADFIRVTPLYAHPDASETVAWMIVEPGCEYGPTFGTENAAWSALTKAPPGSELVELVRRKQ